MHRTGDWLTHLIVDSARQLMLAKTGIYKFDEKVAEIFRKIPIEEWEADRLSRGLKLKLIKMENPFFRIGREKKGAFSLFVRNKNGLNVGLQREALTQMATYVSLITDYGFTRAQTRFESEWMDVVVYDERDSVFIYAENKASDKVLNNLCARLETEFQSEIPAIPEPEEDKKIPHDDAKMKAHHIWRNKPVYFWAVSPSFQQAYRVEYHRFGFSLKKVEKIPQAYEVEDYANVF